MIENVGIGIRKANYAFHKLSRRLRHTKILLGTKKRVLSCITMHNHLYGSECQTITSQIKMRLKVIQMWLYCLML